MLYTFSCGSTRQCGKDNEAVYILGSAPKKANFPTFKKTNNAKTSLRKSMSSSNIIVDRNPKEYFISRFEQPLQFNTALSNQSHFHQDFHYQQSIKYQTQQSYQDLRKKTIPSLKITFKQNYQNVTAFKPVETAINYSFKKIEIKQNTQKPDPEFITKNLEYFEDLKSTTVSPHLNNQSTTFGGREAFEFKRSYSVCDSDEQKDVKQSVVLNRQKGGEKLKKLVERE